MADELGDDRLVLQPLMAGGIAASVIASVATGGLSLFGGAVAATCLAGSIVASLKDPDEGACLPECHPTQAISEESSSDTNQVTRQGKHWQQTVASSRGECRRR